MRAAGVDRLLHFLRRRDGVDEELDQLQAVLAELLADFGRVALADFVELGRQVEQAEAETAQHVGQPRDDQVLEVRRDLLGRVLALRADQRVEQLGRIDHAERELAVAPQADDAEILVADGDRLPRAPFLVEKRLLADEIDLRLERRLLPRDREQPREDRHVHRGQRVPAGAELVQRLAVANEHRLLVRLHDELGPELDIGRAFRRHAMHERAVRFVEKVDDFEAESHGIGRARGESR